ncbi:hypothetical protein EC968_004430 [Mortierella alpina]|nr:hypothetical protein EC968_004430 [Mortierella alpina]
MHHHQSRSHAVQQQLEAESASNGSGWARSPITPTTTRKFNRMAIHEVLEGQNSPPYKRKGSPEESSLSDAASQARSARSRGGSHGNTSELYPHPHHAHFAPNSPRYHRQESPMPASNSEEDEDSDIRNYKKRRMLGSTSSSSNLKQKTPPSSSQPEVMDQVRSTLKLKQQQKAIIEARQSGSHSATPSSTTSAAASQTTTPSVTSATTASHNMKSVKDAPSSGTSQPITEKTPTGISVFHGSASFAAMNRRPLTSPKNPKNAKSLTIFAPSYSESSLSIHSAPLQPSQGHGHPHQQPLLGMNPRTSQPLRNHHHPHPLSQHHVQHTPSSAAGHAKKTSRVTMRAQGPHTAGLDSSSGTLPAPILSSHTGPLPSPMYPHPSTPFHPNNHGAAAAAAAAAASSSSHGLVSKSAFIETVSNLFDSVDSTRSLKTTLEEQIRKSAQLLQTLQSSGTMIESLVRGQFKELEKGVLEKFEGELEHLAARVRQLEEHQGLKPPAKKARTSEATAGSNAMTGVVSSSLPSPPSAITATSKNGTTAESELKDGTLPTPPFNKNQDSAMEVEEEEPAPSTSTSASSSPPPSRDQSSDYKSSVKKLQERVASLEQRQEATAHA